MTATKDFDPPGRFIKQDPITLKWEELSEEMVIRKIFQALRDGRRRNKMKLDSSLEHDDLDKSSTALNQDETGLHSKSAFNGDEITFIIETFLPA